MNPEDATRKLTEKAEQLRKADEGVTSAGLRAVREVAAGVKGRAQRVGDRLDVRVVERRDGVRLTVAGRHAARYRQLIRDELARRAPDVQTEIRAQITGRTR